MEGMKCGSAVIGTGNCRQRRRPGPCQKHYPVTVYDRELRPGGHSHTVTIDYDGTRLAVDVGFIVYNELNYPDLTALFAHLGVETVDYCMSFCGDGGHRPFRVEGRQRQLAGNRYWLVLHKPRNLLSPSYLWILRDILTFNQQSVEDYAGRQNSPALRLATISAPVIFAPRLLSDYLAPMGGRDLVGTGARDAGFFRPRIFVAFFRQTIVCYNMTGRSGAR